MHLADVCVRTGGGVAPEPQGIIGHPDVTAVSVTTPGQPTWAEVISFEDALFAANASNLGPMQYVIATNIQTYLKATPKEAGTAIFRMENSQVNGYTAVANNVATNRRKLGQARLSSGP